jgi:hypothetical protein
MSAWLCLATLLSLPCPAAPPAPPIPPPPCMADIICAIIAGFIIIGFIIAEIPHSSVWNPQWTVERLTHHSRHAHSTHVWPCAHGTGVTAHAARSATDRSTLVTAARVSAPATRVSASTSWDETASSTAASATVYVSTACWATRCARRAVGFAVLAVRLCMTS